MRTILEFPINYSAEEAKERLRRYFDMYGFKTVMNGAEELKRGGSILLFGYYYIASQVAGNTVTLQAFIGKPGKSERDLEGFVGSVNKEKIRDILNEIREFLSMETMPTEEEWWSRNL